MIGFIIRGIMWVVGQLTGAAAIKWLFLSALGYGAVLLIDLIIDLIPAGVSTVGLDGNFSAFTPQMWFFIDYCMLQQGLTIILAAWVARFIKRCLPVVG